MENGDDERRARRAHTTGALVAVFVAVFAGVTVLGLAKYGDPERELSPGIYAGVITVMVATAAGAYLLFAHAVASSRAEQTRLDELEARAREEGRRRRAAEARSEAARRAAASKTAPPTTPPEPPPPPSPSG